MAAFWQPAAGFGALHILSLADIVWHLLSTTSKVTLSGTGVEIQIENVLYDNGCPTDWVNPLFDLQVTSLSPSTPSSSSGGPVIAPMLLPPYPIAGPPISSAARPTPALMRNFLDLAVVGKMVPVPPATQALPRESFRLLIQLGVLGSDGTPLPSSDLLEAVKANDWDKVHSHLLRSTAYKKTLELLESDPGTTFSGRPRAQIAFARCLRQVAKPAPGGPNIVGDRPLSEDHLISFLNSILALPGTDYPVATVCARALLDLGVTPVRFEKALQRLLDTGYTGVSLETGGSVGKGAVEKVFFFNGREIVEDEISTAALYFGGNRPTKSLRRHE